MSMTTVPTTFRSALPSDALPIARLGLRSWLHAYRGLLPDSLLDSRRAEDRVPAWTERIAGQQQVLVCEGPEGLQAFAWFGACQAYPIEGAEPPVDAGEIFAFYLDPGLFGSGLADALLERCEAWLTPRFSTAVLWVLEGNARARRFYSRHGWLPDGARVPFPKPGCDGIHTVRHRKALGA